MIFVALTSAGPANPVLHVVPDPGLLGPGVDPAPGGVVPQGHAQHVGAQGPQLGGGDLRAQGRAEEEGAGWGPQGQVRPQVEEGVAEDLTAIVCWNFAELKECNIRIGSSVGQTNQVSQSAKKIIFMGVTIHLGGG